MLQRVFAILGATVALAPLSGAEIDRDEGLVEDGFITDIDVLAGVKLLPGDLTDEGADDLAYGGVIQYQARGERWPVGLSLSGGVFHAAGGETEVVWREFTFGPYAPFFFGDVRLDVSAGGYAYSHDVVTELGGDEDPNGVGAYAQVALRWQVFDWIDLMTTLRWVRSEQDHTFLDEEVDLSGGTALLGAGFRF